MLCYPNDYIGDEEYNSIIVKYKDINAVIANKKSEIINAQCYLIT